MISFLDIIVINLGDQHIKVHLIVLYNTLNELVEQALLLVVENGHTEFLSGVDCVGLDSGEILVPRQ